MAYYVHVNQRDRFVQDYDEEGDCFSFKRVFWYGPFETEKDALDKAFQFGYQRMCYTIEIIELRLS